MTSEKEIWARFKGGDDQALSFIYAENSKKLYLFGLKMTSNQALVEDSIHDLFSDLVRNRKNLGDTDNIQFYLLKSFKRKLIRLIEKEKRYNWKNDHKEIVFDITYSIEYDIINQEIANSKLHLLYNAINQLTPRQKEAIYLKFTEELEYKEIAEIMGMSLEATRNHIYKAIKSLKDSLKSNTSILLYLFKKIYKKNIKK